MKPNNKNSAGHSKPIPSYQNSGTVVQNKIWKRVREWKSQLIVSGVVVIFAVLSLLNETLDLPHLLAGAPRTPVNWAEIALDVAALFLIGFLSIFMLSLIESKRKRAEEKIKHLSLVLRAIRNVNQLIARENDRDTLLKGICDSLVEVRGYHNAWIVLLDESRRLTMVAETGLGKNFLPMVERLKRGELTDCGQRALEQSSMLTIEDPFSTCADCPLSKSYAGRGAIAVRLEHGGKVYGLLTTSIPSEFLIEKEEQALFQEVAADIALALHNIELEEERKRSQEALKEAYEIINRSPAVAFLWKNEERWPVEFVSNNVRRLFGYTREEFTSGKVSYAKIVHPEDLKRVGNEVSGYSNEKERTNFVHKPYRIITKDGEIKWIDDITHIRRDPEGNITHYEGIVIDITERKRADQALRESEEKWRSLTQNTDDIIMIVDEKGVIRYLNRTMSPHTPEEIIGRLAYEYVPKEQHNIMRESLEEVFKTGMPNSFEVSSNIPEIGTVWFSTKAVPIKDGGKTANVILISTDITQRRQAEEVLRKSERQASAALEAARAFTFSYDIASGKIDWGGAIEEITGYTRREFAKVDIEDWTERIHPDDRDEIRAILKEAIGKDRATAEYRFRTKKGYVTLSSISLTEKQDGKAVRLVGILQDITERKRAEEKINMLSASIEDAYDGITLTEMNGDIIYANKAACEIFGYSHAEIMKLNIAVFSPDQEDAKKLEEGVKKEGRWSGEMRGVRKNKEKFPAILSVSVVKDEKGTPIVRIGVFKDITERKQAEEALRVSEQRYRGLFEDSPISLWEEDFSEIKTHIDSLRTKGVRDFRTYFENHPEVVAHCAAQMKVVDVNKASLELFKAGSKEELRRGLDKTFRQKSYGAFSEELVSLADGKTMFETETLTQTLTGDKKNIALRWTVAPGYEQTYSKVLVSITDITERKRAEKALRESEEKFRSLVENAPNIIMIVDREGIIQFINQTVPGLAAEEVIGKNHLEYVDQEYHGITKDTIEQVFKTGEPSHYEIKGVGSEDSASWYATQIGPIRSEGQIDAVMLITTDITERKKAEEALQSEKDRLQALMEGLTLTGIGIDIVGTDYKVVFQNQTLRERFGDLTGKLCYENYMGLKEPCDFCPMLKAIKNDKVKSVELNAADGRNYELISAPFPNPDGTVDKVVEVVMDITERKQMEEALKQKVAELNTFINNIPDMAWLKDADSRFIAANKAFGEAARMDMESLINQSCEVCFGKEAAKKFREDDLEIMKGRKQVVIEEKIINSEGNEVFLETVKSPIFGESGRVVGTVGIARNITERKKMEAQLIQAERLTAVGTLAYGIAHEFNNILAGILGNAEFGMGSGDSKEVEECFRVIMENCGRAGSITNSLLTLARQRQAKKEVADLTNVVENVLGLVERELEKQNIKVERKFKPVPEIVCDLGELSEVWLNMITNARDAMKPDGGALTIEIRKRNHNIEIIFADTGGGIPDEIKGRIFEPFVTTKGALGQSEIPGTGLGLFLSIGIISRYHGKIEVESQVGKGSKFTIRIPVTQNQQLPDRAEAEDEGPTVLPPDLKVLLVDDEETICNVVKKFLEEKGYSVVDTTSGKKGLKLFKDGTFDLVLSDITMPDMDGIKLVSKLKAMDPQIKVVTFTGHVAEEKLEAARKAGADQILAKPFKKEDLYRAIVRALSV